MRARRAAPRTRASASRSSGCGHHSARPRSNALSARGARARGSSRPARVASWRASKPSAAASLASTATSSGSSALSALRRAPAAPSYDATCAQRVHAARRCARRPSARRGSRAAASRARARAPPGPCAGRAAAPSRRSRVPSYSMSSFVTAARTPGGAASLDQLEEDHLGRVGATRTELEDAGVAARPLRVARSDLLEQLVDGELVLAERRQRLAPGVQVAALGERDQLLDLGLDGLGLGLGRLDPLVLDDLLAEVAQQRLAVRGVRESLWRVFWWRMAGARGVPGRLVAAQLEAARPRASR